MMSRHVCVYVVFVALGLLLRTESALAQPKEEPKPVEGQLTYQDLKTMLENLGYDEVKELRNKDDKITGIEVKRVAGWTFYGVFTLSTDKSNVWISMNLGKISDPGSVPSKVMLGLLAANDKVWPSYFYYSESNNRLYLDSALTNRGLKAKDLRARFDAMCENVKTYEPLWNAEKWPEAKK